MKDLAIFMGVVCDPNPGKGGYTAIIADRHTDRAVKLVRGGYKHTTSNRLLLRSLIHALKELSERSWVYVISDSTYLITSLAERRVEQWEQNGWRSSSGEVKNRDLWSQLLKLTKGHSMQYKQLSYVNTSKFVTAAKNGASEQAVRTNLPEDLGYSRKTMKQKPTPARKPIESAEMSLLQWANERLSRFALSPYSYEGQSCPNCNGKLVRHQTNPRRKEGQRFGYTHYFMCPECRIPKVDEESLFEP